MYLYRSMLYEILKLKAVRVYLGLGLFPLLPLVLSFIKTGFFQFSGENASMSAFAMITGMIYTQFQFVLPMIILAYMANCVFYEEIKYGRILVFKDQSRRKILGAKWGALFTVFWMYYGLICLSSLVTYYVYLIHKPVASGLLFSASDLSSVKTVVAYCLTSAVAAALVFCASLRLSNGYTILLMISYLLFAMIATRFHLIRYAFPTGYIDANASVWLMVVVGVGCLVALFEGSRWLWVTRIDE